MKKIYLQNISLILIIGIFILCFLLFFGKFQYNIDALERSVVHGYSSKTQQENKPLRSRGRNIIHLMIQQSDFDGFHLKQVLQQIMMQHMQGPRHTLPISQESIDWMTRLPFDHAISMLQILSHTHPVDWQEQVVSLRNLPNYEQKRALKINRFNSNSSECFDGAACHD